MNRSIENKNCLGNWIAKTHLRLKNNLTQKIRKYNLTVEQRQILLLLYDCGSMTQREICKETLSESSNITVTIKRMEQNGFVSKQKHPDDKRTTLIYPTQKALDIKDELRAIGKENLDSLLSNVSTEEREIALNVLKEIYKQTLLDEVENLL